MNIFYLDKDVNKSAEYQNDKHCVKMIVEYAQLLCTAHGELNVANTVMNDTLGLYRPKHKNDTSCIWVSRSNANFDVLYRLCNALCKKFTHR